MSDVENKIILKQMENKLNEEKEGCSTAISLVIGLALIIYVVLVAC